MLKILRPEARRPSTRAVVPAHLERLIAVAQQGDDMVPEVQAIVRNLGFDSFLCGWSSASRPDRDALLYVFTTLPYEWTAVYDREHYVEVDPRVQLAEEITSLFCWSADELRGAHRGRDRFFDDAARFGIRSGACFGWRDPEGNAVLIAFNSSRRTLDRLPLREISDSLYGFGHAFHDIFVRSVIQNGIPSRLRGIALTRREIESLQYVARGLTIQDIAPKMGISPRTVRYHVESATTKLGALKREEAIALAAKGGLLDIMS